MCLSFIGTPNSGTRSKINIVLFLLVSNLKLVFRVKQFVNSVKLLQQLWNRVWWEVRPVKSPEIEDLCKGCRIGTRSKALVTVYLGRPVKFRQFCGAGKSSFLDTEKFEITKGKCQACFKHRSLKFYWGQVYKHIRMYLNKNGQVAPGFKRLLVIQRNISFRLEGLKGELESP